MNTSFQSRIASRAMSPVVEPWRSARAPEPGRPVELDFCQDAVAIYIDQTGLILAAEPLCPAVFEWDPAELVGQALEVLLIAGTDSIRQRLVPAQDPLGSGTQRLPPLFALAQRRDGTSFPVAVSLQERVAGSGVCWAVAFYDVHGSPLAQPEVPAAGGLHPSSTPEPPKAQVAAPFTLEDIPDLFQRGPLEPAPQPGGPGDVAAQPPALPAPLDFSQTQPAAPAPVSETAQGVPADSAQVQAQAAPVGRPEEPEPEPAPPQATPPGDALEDNLELQSRLRDSVVALARVTAELETERGERQRSEERAAFLADQMQGLHEELKAHLEFERISRQRLIELEKQLREREKSLAKASAALQKEIADRQLAEEQLRTLADLQAKPSLVEEAREAFHRAQQDLEQRLQSRLKAVAESELLRSRYQAAGSARNGRALVNGLRRQMEPPVQTLHQSACRLLQLKLPDDQKHLAQTMLENALLLQTSLRQSSQEADTPAQPDPPPNQPAPKPAGEDKTS